jgi:hypothetical protein
MNKTIIFLIFILPLTIFSQDTAQKILDKSIKAYGGKKYESLNVSLDFRQFHLTLKHEKGMFFYERTTTDSQKIVWRDVLDNSGFHREKNGLKVELSKKDHARYLEGINSQVYFLLLPYKLKDKAVILTYLGEGEVEGKKQFKLKVTFKKEGGGTDFEDEFCYWINQKTYLIDYLAYTNGGPRFRKATVGHKVGGVIFQDYENYEMKDKTIPSTEYDKIFMEGTFKLLSKIEHKNVKEAALKK